MCLLRAIVIIDSWIFTIIALFAICTKTFNFTKKANRKVSSLLKYFFSKISGGYFYLR